MRRQFFLASAGAMALAGTALAADLPIAPPPPPPVFTWTGIYIGGYGGGEVTEPLTIRSSERLSRPSPI
jgi:opacity protein-like surface antigen